MALQKTSVQIDPEIRKQLETLYPGYTISEVIRLALDYVIEVKPVVVQRRTKLQAQV